MPFLLDGNPTSSEISDAVNYLLSNFDTTYSANSVTGQITGPTGVIVGYLYRYMAVKYADSQDGSVNFSNLPTNRQYYGLRNSNDAAESSNPVDYVWFKVTGGFSTSKYLWYICTGGRQIQFRVATSAPDAGWLQVDAGSIDLDVVTSSTTPIILESFASYFTPAVMLVPRTGSPLAPVFTSVSPILYATDKGTVVPYSGATTDSGVSFINSTWRIGNSSTTGFGDISYNGITIGNPTDGGDYAIWPNPTAMSTSPAYITVPVRYKNSTGVVTQAAVAVCQLVFADPGAQGPAGPTVDISGFTGFTQNSAGAFTPPNATLSGVVTNVTSPTYSWAISSATPSSSTASSVVVTPNSSATSVNVTLTVNGSNLTSPISRTISMPVVFNGAAGTAGSNGQMSAFPTIFIWTGSSTPPTRPSTTSTFTWATGSYTAPSGWSTSAPGNTTPGNYLWSITIPLNTSATTTTSTLDWTDTANPIRAVGYNGTNGTNGTNGATGSSGSATFLVTRSANDSSPPTNAEVTTAIGRNPVAGDIVTVSYNNYNNAVVYRYVTSWILQTTYITGSLIVQNTITADKLAVNALSTITANTGTLTVSGSIQAGNAYQTGTSMGNAGAIIYSDGRFAVGDQYRNIAYNGTILTLNGDIVANGNLQALSVTASKIATNTITANQIATNTITANQIAANTITADKLSVTSLKSVSASTGRLIVTDDSGGTTGSGYIQAGNAYQTGTSMGGSGAIIYSNGVFALGNSTTNVSFNGSQMTLNGNVVATGNVLNNAITNAQSYTTNAYPTYVVRNNWAVGGVYRGGWDASSNSPALSSGVGTTDDWYFCYLAGNTYLDGISTWYPSDLVYFDGSVWTKAWQVVATLPAMNFTEAPQNVLITAAVNILGNFGQTSRIQVVELNSGAVAYPNGTYATSSTVLPFMFNFTGIAAGNRVFQLQVNQQSGGGTYQLGNITLSAVGFKR
jgi:hypothetical protein